MERSPLSWPGAALIPLLALNGTALACSDHEGPAVGRDPLAANYPGALDILPAVAAPRRERVLPPANPMATLWTDKFPLQRHTRAAEKFEDALNLAGRGGAPIAFSMVMIGPMLWTRYAPAEGRAKATIHTERAQPGELVLVSAEDVISAIGDGRWASARRMPPDWWACTAVPSKLQRFSRSMEITVVPRAAH